MWKSRELRGRVVAEEAPTSANVGVVLQYDRTGRIEDEEESKV